MSCLLDIGPLLAYLDANDPAHTAVVPRLGAVTAPMATTSAVITEVMYFFGKRDVQPEPLLAFIRFSGLTCYDFSQPPEMAVCMALMERYADTPMDYADATLVLLAERLQSTAVLTLDRRGFSTYRTREGKSFTLLLDQ